MQSYTRYNLKRFNFSGVSCENVFAALAFVMGMALPTSTLLFNITFILMIIGVLTHTRLPQFFSLVKEPLIYFPLILFSLLALSLVYYSNSEGMAVLLRYKKLLFVPFFVLFFQDRFVCIKQYINGFLWANAVILILSSLVGVFHLKIGNINPLDPSVFKLHITQNFFMAFAVLLWIALAYHHSGRKRIFYGMLGVLASYNILFLVLGRTGYIALFIVLLVWFWLSFDRVKRVIFLVLMALFLGAFLLIPNQAMNRLHLGMQEAEVCLAGYYRSHAGQECDTSMGLRVDFSMTALSRIRSAPIFGSGVGGFVYKDKNHPSYGINPHNQYLLEMVQLGVIGLLLILSWLAMCYYTIWQEAKAIRNVSLAILSAYVISGFFNAFLLDFSEGLFFLILNALWIALKRSQMGISRSISA